MFGRMQCVVVLPGQAAGMVGMRSLSALQPHTPSELTE